MTIVIPWIPPSVNHYVQHTRAGRHYKTKSAIAFQYEICLAVREQQMRRVELVGVEFLVTIHVTLGPKERGDVDNFGKVCLDALAQSGVIKSDAAVRCLRISKSRGKESRTDITIIGWHKGDSPA